MSLDQLIEAVLFWKAEPVSLKDLAAMLTKSEAEVGEALNQLEAALATRGVRLIRNNESVALGTAPEASDLIARLAKEELSRDLGKAGLETLSIVLYQGPVTRAEIDYIRGVNSSFILRHLQIRDLVEKIPDPADARRFLYRPSFALLQHLGISKVEELPEYGALKEELAKLTDNKENAQNDN